MSDSGPNSFIKFSGLAFEMLAFIIIGVWGGQKLDDYFQTPGYYTIILSLLAVAGSIIYIIRKLPKN